MYSKYALLLATAAYGCTSQGQEQLLNAKNIFSRESSEIWQRYLTQHKEASDMVTEVNSSLDIMNNEFDQNAYYYNDIRNRRNQIMKIPHAIAPKTNRLHHRTSERIIHEIRVHAAHTKAF